jgi:NAD(P)-dependent dehydrogenase (short-subunit alcohol dehydrogenase family)
VITGSTAGIGRACAMLFADEGAQVVVSDHGADPSLGPETVSAIHAQGGRARYIRADVTSPGEIHQLIARTLEEYDSIDILMNNAYAGQNNSLLETPLDDWDRAYAITIKAVAAACQAVVPRMIERSRGSIINTASVQGLLASRRNAAYNTFKAALINLTRQMAVDYGRFGIRVNALCPGRILTEAKVKMLAEHPEEVRRQELVYPLGRPGTVNEAAQAALFLASDQSSFVTGHALVVDGGLTAQLQDSVGAMVDEALNH